MGKNESHAMVDEMVAQMQETAGDDKLRFTALLLDALERLTDHTERACEAIRVAA